MLKRILALLLLLTLVIPGLSTVVSAQSTWVCPEGFEGQTLRIFNWANYVAETTIPDFEAACGVTVEYFEYGTNDELLTIMEVGTTDYDIIVPTVDLIPMLAERELIQAVDPSLVPNTANIGPIIQSLPIETAKEYSVPYQWGTIGIAYDATAVDAPITTWDEFFAYDGRVVWIDDSRLLLKIALLKLGYSFSSIDEAEIQEAGEYLLTVPQNDVFAISATSQAELLYQGEVDAVVAHSRSVVPIIEDCECEDFVYVFPSDGFVGYYDVMAIPTNAPNPQLAHAFMDYILDPQVSADLSSALGSATPVDIARPLVDESVLNNGISYPGDAMLEAFVSDTVILDQLGQAVSIYVEVWNNVKAQLVNQ